MSKLTNMPRLRRNAATLETWSFRAQIKTFSSVAEILVGPEQTRFLIHKELLAHHSPFFNAALNGSFTEGLHQCIRLPDEDVDTFEHFVHWLYAQQIDGSLFNDGKPKYYLLLQLYSLSDRLCVEDLRNRTVDKIAELSELTNSVLTPTDTCTLFDTIRDSSLVRKLVLDLFAFKQTDRLLAEHPDDWHPEFLRELCVKLKRPSHTSMLRHDITTWKPESWSLTKACNVCRKILRPQLSAHMCAVCRQAYCTACSIRGAAMCTSDWPIDCASTCKPWNGSLCARYHEHLETPMCAENVSSINGR